MQAFFYKKRHTYIQAGLKALEGHIIMEDIQRKSGYLNPLSNVYGLNNRVELKMMISVRIF